MFELTALSQRYRGGLSGAGGKAIPAQATGHSHLFGEKSFLTPLHKKICSALEIEHRKSKVDACRRIWCLGDFVPTTGLAFPVFLTQQEDQDELLEAAKNLCLLHADPFVLLAPRRRRLSPPTGRASDFVQRKQIIKAKKRRKIQRAENGAGEI